MSTNLSVESPNFDEIASESGNFTSDAISLLWAAINDTRANERRHYRLSTEMLAPKVLTSAPSASVDNLDLEGASILSFTGSSAVNFTGMRAPETGKSRVVFVQVSGSATITAKNAATSEALNQLVNSTGGDVALDTGAGIIYAYLEGKWREVARSG